MGNWHTRHSVRRRSPSEDMAYSDFTYKYWSCKPRVAHVAFTDGVNMYVYGGYHTRGINHCESQKDELMIYNHSLNAWFMKICTGDFPNPVLSGTSCVVIAPYAYFIGGHQSHVEHQGFVYRLHLGTFMWEKVTDGGLSPRDKFAAWVYKDKIYCFGGWGKDIDGPLHNQGYFLHAAVDSQFEPIGWNNQLLIFDPDSVEWESPICKGALPSPRAAHTASVVGNCAYIYGGRHLQKRLHDIHCLNMDTLTWMEIKQPHGSLRPCGRSWHCASAISDHEFFVFGGFDTRDNVLGDAWIFDTETNQWKSVIRHHSNCRLWHTNVFTNSGEILIFGGCNSSILVGSVEYEKYPREIIKIQLQPYSLLRICSDFVAKEFRRNSWQEMPEPMRTSLKRKQTVLACLEYRGSKKQHVPTVINGYRDTTRQISEFENGAQRESGDR